MKYELVDTEMCGTTANLEHTLNGVFLAAHLLTGSTGQAETAVQEAIESWDPDEDTEEKLVQQALKAAVQTPTHWAVLNRTESGSALPAELQAVLRLSPRFRQCFVLRILLGQSHEACGRLLGLSSERVDEYTCAALQSLAKLTPAKLTTDLELLAYQQFSWTRTIRWTD